MTEKQPKATPVKTFFAEVGWRIKQGFGNG